MVISNAWTRPSLVSFLSSSTLWRPFLLLHPEDNREDAFLKKGSLDKRGLRGQLEKKGGLCIYKRYAL